MRGSDFVRSLPEGKTKEQYARREQMILDAVRRRDIAPIEWVPIITTFGPYTATFRVSLDDLRIGNATDSKRVEVSHETGQHIIDDLGVAPLTPKLSDEIYAQAPIKLPPKAHPDAQKWVTDGTMAYTSRMVAYHDYIDQLIAQAIARNGGKRGLIADVGKDWVISPTLWQAPAMTSGCVQSLIRSMNYGWHTPSKWIYHAVTMPNVQVYQPFPGTCHGLTHTDYSQTLRLVRRDVDVCGPGIVPLGSSSDCVKMDIAKVATDPQLAGLLSHEGPFVEYRHPHVAPACNLAAQCPSIKQGFTTMSESTTCTTGNCTPLPPPQSAPDIAAASVSPLRQVVVFGGAAALGYYGFRWFASQLAARA